MAMHAVVASGSDAGVETTIFVDLVAVITGFVTQLARVSVFSHDAIAAIGVKAVVGAGIGIVIVAVVACLKPLRKTVSKQANFTQSLARASATALDSRPNLKVCAPISVTAAGCPAGDKAAIDITRITVIAFFAALTKAIAAVGSLASR